MDLPGLLGRTMQKPKWGKSTVTHILALTAGLAFALPLHAEPIEDISNGGATVIHNGSGNFAVHLRLPPGELHSDKSIRLVNLQQVVHGYDTAIDTDVPLQTNVTLNDLVGSQIDQSGRKYALITLYQVDPPLADLPSREAGIDRGIDMRTPADMVKSTYSNYVSPVFTDCPSSRHLGARVIFAKED